MIEIISDDFKKAEALLKDLIFEEEVDRKNASHFKTLKLLKARQENIDFEMRLAEKICGDDPHYPYRSSFYLTKFFQDLGYQFVHNGDTRRFWVQGVLYQLSIQDIAYLIEKGLFLKKHYDGLKSKTAEGMPVAEPLLQAAIKDFSKFINDSIAANETVSLTEVLDLNLNLDLLFGKRACTKDDELNKLIEEAKSRFLDPNDKYIAIEKLWDAFERIKTYFDGEDKSQSAKKLLTKISDGFDDSFLFEEEFKKLTIIGNSYRIRHHETDKKEIKDPKHLTYLFFSNVVFNGFMLKLFGKKILENISLSRGCACP
jgi:hypothetical protein